MLGESTRGRHSHSTPPLGRDQRHRLAIRQEGVLGDRRERAAAQQRAAVVSCRICGSVGICGREWLGLVRRRPARSWSHHRQQLRHSVIDHRRRIQSDRLAAMHRAASGGWSVRPAHGGRSSSSGSIDPSSWISMSTGRQGLGATAGTPGTGRDARAARPGQEAAAADGPDPPARLPADPAAVQAVPGATDGRPGDDHLLGRDQHSQPVPAARGARRRAPRARRNDPDRDRPRDDRHRAGHPGDRRLADIPVKRRRPAGDARPARRRLPPPAADVAGVLHADPNRRGAVADRQRHRRPRQRRHEHGHDDRLERHHGGGGAGGDVPAGLAARAALAGVRAAVGVDDPASREDPPPDHHRAAAPAGRHERAGRRVAVGLRDHARQDDGPRLRPRRPFHRRIQGDRRPGGPVADGGSLDDGDDPVHLRGPAGA